MMLLEDSMQVLGCSPEGRIPLHAAIVGQCQSAAAATKDCCLLPVMHCLHKGTDKLCPVSPIACLLRTSQAG